MNGIVTRNSAARIGLEMLAVVASILIAFSLDAWWSRRAEVRTELAHLRALQSDFEQNIQGLAGAIDREERIADASRRLLLAAVLPNVTSPEDSLRFLMGAVFNSGRFDPVMGAYEAVVSSGGLAQVRDDSLRLALAGFASLLQVRYTEHYADELYLDFTRSYTGRLGLTAAVAASESGRVIEEAGPQRDLLSDPKFREHLALRYLAAVNVAESYQEMLRKAEAVLTLVRRALE